MKNWKKWVAWIVISLYAIITATYGLLTEQSQCKDFPILTVFDCYADFLISINAHKLLEAFPVAIAVPLFIILYFIIVYLVVKLLDKIINSLRVWATSVRFTFSRDMFKHFDMRKSFILFRGKNTDYERLDEVGVGWRSDICDSWIVYGTS